MLNSTRYDIVTAFGRLRAETEPGDNVLIYYAGHGHLDRDTESGYWLPVDAEPDNEANWLANESITRGLRAMPAKHVMVIADSCYSGTLVRAAPVGLKTGAERTAWLRRMAEKRTRTALVSGGLEPVMDGGGGGHSVFAKALLDILGGNAEVLDGHSLFTELSRLVVVNAEQTPQYSDVRNAGHEGGEFLFVPLGFNPAASTAPAQPAASQTGGQPRPEAEELFWQSINSSDKPSDYQAYLQTFPNGVFAPLARARLQQLSERKQAEGGQSRGGDEPRQAALTAPPSPPSPTTAVVGVSAPRSGLPAVGTSFRDCAECPEMVVIPAGTFTMGSPEGEAGRDADEGPQRRVTIARPLAVGKYEVTRSGFAVFVRESGHDVGNSCYVWTGGKWEKTSDRSWRNPGYVQTDQHPVACVNWGDAKAYAAWLTRKTGKGYRLLSEAEWEYAARAGATTIYPWGEAVGRNNANCDGCGSQWDNEQTAPVGSFGANRFGLHDVAGNLWEWVEDCWHENYAGAPSDGGAWTSGGDCGRHVLRGGSWSDFPGILRAADRDGGSTGNRNSFNGFRVVRTD